MNKILKKALAIFVAVVLVLGIAVWASAETIPAEGSIWTPGASDPNPPGLPDDQGGGNNGGGNNDGGNHGGSSDDDDVGGGDVVVGPGEACPKDETCPIAKFTDAVPTAWYHDGVHYCLERGLMNGVGDNQFSPNGTTSRAMIVTILWRLEDSPVVNYTMSFRDVGDTWYTEAVRWAASEGIVEGYSDTEFGPNNTITREQMATIMWRYASYKGYDVSVADEDILLSYGDVRKVSAWAVTAMQWACEAELIQGIAEGNTMNLVPGGSATRAQAATILYRFVRNVAKAA